MCAHFDSSSRWREGIENLTIAGNLVDWLRKPRYLLRIERRNGLAQWFARSVEQRHVEMRSCRVIRPESPLHVTLYGKFAVFSFEPNLVDGDDPRIDALQFDMGDIWRRTKWS